MSSHCGTCRCNLHQRAEQRALNARRHQSYRQLAFAILGPTAPRDDAGLVSALAEHARLLEPAALAVLNDYQAA
jgi:hypothetical protein